MEKELDWEELEDEPWVIEVVPKPRLKCLRCGHIWIPRGEGKPRVCPECKSPWWDKEKDKDD